LAPKSVRGAGRKKLVLYSVPFIALALLVAIYFAVSANPQAQQDFTIPIAIQIYQLNQGSAYVSNVLPINVGIRGGIWKTNQYDNEGINGHYPVFAQQAPGGNTTYSIIHVRSTVSRTYTLQDFFNVWGQPLGETNTLNFTIPPPANDPRFNPYYGWFMCIRIEGGRIQQGHWGNQTLVPGLGIVLKYSDEPCLPIS